LNLPNALWQDGLSFARGQTKYCLGDLVSPSFREQPVGIRIQHFGLSSAHPAFAGSQYRWSINFPVHFALKTALLLMFAGSASQKLNPNFSRRRNGPMCPPQKPSASRVLQKARLHLTDQGMLDLGPENTPSEPPLDVHVGPSGR